MSIEVGTQVRHIGKEVGTVRSFVTPKPGWKRALVAWPDHTEQYVDVDSLREVNQTSLALDEPDECIGCAARQGSYCPCASDVDDDDGFGFDRSEGGDD